MTGKPEELEKIKKKVSRVLEERNIQKVKLLADVEDVRRRFLTPELQNRIEGWVNEVQLLENLFYDEEEEAGEILEEMIDRLLDDFSFYLRCVEVIVHAVLEGKPRADRQLIVINRALTTINSKVRALLMNVLAKKISPSEAANVIKEAIFPLLLFVDCLAFSDTVDYTILAAVPGAVTTRAEKLSQQLDEDAFTVLKIIYNLYMQSGAQPVKSKMIRIEAVNAGLQPKKVTQLIRLLKKNGLITGDARSGYIPTEDAIRLIMQKQQISSPQPAPQPQLQQPQVQQPQAGGMPPGMPPGFPGMPPM